MGRDYKKEYQEYHSKPEQKKNRAKRNKANRNSNCGPGQEVDHKVPLIRGGSNSPSNWRVVSEETNRKKGSKKMSSFDKLRLAIAEKTAAPEGVERLPSGGIKYRGETFPGYNKPKAAPKGSKHKKRVLAKKGDKVKVVNFGARGYKHNYSAKAKKSYLARSSGIKGKDDKFSANYWSRRELWPKNQKADGSAKKRSKSASAAPKHLELRRQQRAKYLDPENLKTIEDKVQSASDLPEGANYITLPHGRKAVVRTEGGKSHLATILGPAMRPPGRDVSSMVKEATGFNKQLFIKEAVAAATRKIVARRMGRYSNYANRSKVPKAPGTPKRTITRQQFNKKSIKPPVKAAPSPTTPTPATTSPTSGGRRQGIGDFVNNHPGATAAGGVVAVGGATLGANKYKQHQALQQPAFRKVSSYKQANDLSVLTAVPKQNLDLIMRKGLYSQKAMLEDPEVMAAFLAKIRDILTKTSEEQPLLRHRSTLLIRDPETGKLLAANNREDRRFDDASPFYFPGGGLYDDEYGTPRTPTEEEILEGARREALEELGISLTNPRVVGGSTNMLPQEWRDKVLKRRGVPYEGGHEHLVLADKGDVDNSLYNVEGDAFTKGEYYDPQEVYNSLTEYGNSEGQFAAYNRSQAKAIKEHLLNKQVAP